ncbi:MAG: glycosyltransferase [Candidatus Hydrogenedentes bacterium]|nr:glycosyltransferase [Candidatus Hydrogenedentota bacterium]
MPMRTLEQRIPPVRGLIAVHNQWGGAFSAIDLRRWMRLNRIVFNVEKVDVLAHGAAAARVCELLEPAGEWGLRLSLRTNCATPPPSLKPLADDGLLDVLLAPASLDAPQLAAWLAACREAALPVRLQIPATMSSAFDVAAFVKRARDHGVVVVNIAAFDPFTPPFRGAHQNESRVAIGAIQMLTRALEDADIECNVIGIPFCQAEEQSRSNIVNSRQFHLDHQHYGKASYEQALNLYRNVPAAVSKIILILLARSTFQRTFVDAVLLRLLLHMRLVYGWSVALHKLTRHLRSRYLKPREGRQSIEQVTAEIEKVRAREMATLGPVCSKCSLRRICDHGGPEFANALPGLVLRAIEGELVVSPLHFAVAQPKHYDAVDAERLKSTEGHDALVKEANAVVENRAPDRQIMPYEYTIESAPYEHLEGGVRWHSITNTEKLSSPLEHVEPPFTISVTFGGGIAEFIGFSFGRHCKLLCSMEGYRHTAVLHVAADGHYVLLRDGKPVHPVEFDGMFYVPMRLAGRLEPRIAIWNIDAQIVTQFVKIWFGEHTHEQKSEGVKFSIVVVNTRYARRLQAVLRSIAQQRDIDLAKIEVIVCYVPGLDATDDLIDSMRLSYPGLRILRSPFPVQNSNSKGFMINESVNMASGEWVVLMDADIIIAPNMFARIDALGDDAKFVAPDGRLMLSKENTAKILIGEVRPWEHWDELVNSGGEYRYREARGVPVGFFQCFRREFIQEVKYAELDHFEGADMWFGMALQDRYGKETRLSGIPVLHLDHGGSQWYGTTKHF